MSNTNKISSRVDWLIIFLFIAIILLGFVNLYSSDYKPNNTEYIAFFSNTYGRQLIWIGVSLVLATIILFIDSATYSMFAYFIYIAVMAILFMVLIYGAATHGAKSWFVVGAFKIQPSELAKFSTALAVAKFIDTNNFSFKNTYNALLTIAIVFLPVFLILLQPDVGSAMVYSAFIFVLYREGLPGNILWFLLIMIIVFVLALVVNQALLSVSIALFAILLMYFLLNEKKSIFRIFLGLLVAFSSVFIVNSVVALHLKLINIILITLLLWIVYLAVYFYQKNNKENLLVLFFLFSALVMQFTTDIMFHQILRPHQRNRIDVLFDGSIDPRGVGYQLKQSKIAIGSGGWSGKGFLKGTQTKLNFVPEHNTDFIFCTVAEEWGFVGTVLLFILYAALIIRIFFRAEKQLSPFSRIYGYSVASLIFIHFIINIGMTIGIVPVIGIPLPFFSYGGSSMLGFTILLFIFIKLDTDKDLKL